MSTILEADESVLEQNLKFVHSDFQDELVQFFGGANEAPPCDYKVITTKPGNCIKTYKVNTNEKFFINICLTLEIPAPKDITEFELMQIINSDQPSTFRIPMSITEPRTTKDKSDNLVDVCDIAINAKFFEKCDKSRVFKDFFFVLIARAISEKYNVQLLMEKAIVLKNRKFMGTLIAHRVRNTDVDKQQFGQHSKTKLPTALVEEIQGGTTDELQQKNSQIKQPQKVIAYVQPEFKLRAKLQSAHSELVEEVQAEFYLPKCISSQDFTLDIGEDRIQVESLKYCYLFDNFVGYQLNQNLASAIFDKTTKILEVRMPVLQIQ